MENISYTSVVGILYGDTEGRVSVINDVDGRASWLGDGNEGHYLKVGY